MKTLPFTSVRPSVRPLLLLLLSLSLARSLCCPLTRSLARSLAPSLYSSTYDALCACAGRVADAAAAEYRSVGAYADDGGSECVQ